MRKLIQICCCLGALMSVLPAAFGFSLLGPLGNAGDAWQTGQDGFNPLGTGNPFLFEDGALDGPKNIGEEYRRNTPVMYFTFDDNFVNFFGSNGTNAVFNAFDVLNNLTNVDSYSSNLTEFPLQADGFNYQAQALGLIDLKSLTLAMLTEQLGLADSVRYTWVLHSRWHTGTVPCPVGQNYLVTERNFDIIPSALSQLQYTPYVNDALYTYYIYEDCGAPVPGPIDGAAVPFVADPLVDNPPVASGVGMGSLLFGGFYTGLTRDDVAGLRYLLRAANVNTESPAAGSLVQSNTLASPAPLTTSDLGALIASSITNDPATLVTNFPGLLIANSTSYYTNVSTPILGTTNYIGEPYGSPPHVVTNGYTQTFVQHYLTTFANVVTNSFHSNTVAQLVTTLNGTNSTTPTTVVLANVPSGDYYLLPSGTCGWNLTTQVITNVTTVTTVIATATNISGVAITQSLTTLFTNHTFIAQQELCPYVTPSAGKYEGIENIKFVGVNNNLYDSLLGQFYTPITNNYTMSLYTSTNGVVTIQNFQRVVTTPDFLFSANDQTSIGGVQNGGTRTTPNFNQANILNGLAGPGTIDPSSVIAFNNSGPVYVNQQVSFLNGPNYGQGFIYGSFDGTTNTPVVYPNGTSIANLENEVFIQLSPATLPVATVSSAYSAAFSATGGRAPYAWSLAPGSPALPNGLSLSPGGVISGTPTQNGVYDFIIQMNDSASHTVQENYFITIH